MPPRGETAILTGFALTPTWPAPLGVVKHSAGAFTWGFIATSAVCVVGVALARLHGNG